MIIRVGVTDNAAATVQLTDEDKGLLERWQQMQQQCSISSLPSTSNQQFAMTAVTSTTAKAADNLQLCSADSRVADHCLADIHLTWTPSISLSSADITSCLQVEDSSMATTADRSASVDRDECNKRRVTETPRIFSAGGYGIGEIMPLSSR